MSKSLGLVQLRAESKRTAKARKEATQFLADAAARLHSPRMAYLATRMKFDPFGALRDGIDDMSGSLVKENEDEVQHKDGCVTDFTDNDHETVDKKGEKKDLEVIVGEVGDAA